VGKLPQLVWQWQSRVRRVYAGGVLDVGFLEERHVVSLQLASIEECMRLGVRSNEILSFHHCVNASSLEVCAESIHLKSGRTEHRENTVGCERPSLCAWMRCMHYVCVCVCVCVCLCVCVLCVCVCVCVCVCKDQWVRVKGSV
jgi:hypothetical protein